ncbi:hypothetical protein ACFTY8_06365 [Streptomyces mirabilis]|uniref:hypothetical protein n=1 Tax=Streptomyces mirabilis TaxID=68239 RepID=UPI00363682AF
MRRHVAYRQLNDGSGGSGGHGAGSGRDTPRRRPPAPIGPSVSTQPAANATVLRHWTADKDRFGLPLEKVLAHLHTPDDQD